MGIRKDLYTVISRASPFPILRVLVGIFSLHNLKQTVKNLVRRRVLRRPVVKRTHYRPWMKNLKSMV